MYISSLYVKDFRNYSQQKLCLTEGAAILYGKNGQGKTNLLEAVALLCTGRSHRTPRDKELIRQGEERARVRMETVHKDGRHSVDMVLSRTDKKRVLLNGLPISRISQMVGKVRCVLFSPEDLSVVKSGPAQRRRFMDIYLCQAYPAYFYALGQYNRTLDQRNRLLKRPVGEWKKTLDVFDLLLAKNAQEVLRFRAEFLEKLFPLAAQNYEGLSNEKGFKVEYQPGAPLLAEDFIKALCAARENDVRKGNTSLGPHRDELSFSLAGNDLRVFGSQGQQRTAALALKLSEMDLCRESLQEYPLLLLDDVLSELDIERQALLLTRIQGMQAIITAAQLSPRLTALPGAKVFRVEAGSIKE